MKEWHLTATTPEKKKRMEFVTVYRPHRLKDRVPDTNTLERIKGGYLLKAKLSDGELSALLPTSEDVTMKADGLESKGTIKCRLMETGGQVQILGLDE